MTRDADLELIEDEARGRALHKLRHPHPAVDPDTYVATEAIAVTGWTVCAWAWMDGDREFIHVERLHYIEAAYWRDQVAQLARLDEGGAS